MPRLYPASGSGGGGGAGATQTYVTIADETATLTNSQQFGNLIDDGTLAARPTAGTAGRIWTVTSGASAGNIYYDNGTTWVTIYDYTSLPELIRDTIGTALVAGGGITKIVDDPGDTITLGSNPANYGAVLILGDSRTQLGGNGTSTASTSPANQFENFARRVAAVLDVPDVWPMGKSGAMLTSPTAGRAVDGTLSGLGALLRFIYPGHWYAPRSGSHTSLPTRATGKPFPALPIIMFGLNEPTRNAASAPYEGAACYERHLRTLVARLSAAMVYGSDSSLFPVTYSGFGTTVTTGDSGHAYLEATGGSWRKSTTNTDTFTITIPAELPFDADGICRFFVTLIGPTNTRCYLNGALGGAVGDTTLNLEGTTIFADAPYKVLTAGDIVKVDSEYITLGSTADGGITWTGCTRGANGSTRTSHSDRAVVTLPTDTIRVGWSSSTAPTPDAHAATYVAGAGYGQDPAYTSVVDNNVRKSPGLVTVVFDLTAADAGLTIVGTVAGKIGNEFVGLDSFGIIDPDPNPVLIVNTPDMLGGIAGPGYLYTGSIATPYNDAVDTIVAEFENAVLVDHATDATELWLATVQTAISSIATTTLKITPTSTTRCVINVGSVLRVVGTAASVGNTELMLVTAIDKTNGGANDGTWSLTVTRGYESSTKNDSIVVGRCAMDRRWLSPDSVHPSDLGHAALAELVLETLTVTARTIAQTANAGALVTKNVRMRDGGYVPLLLGSTRTTLTPTLGVVYSYPLIITEPAILEGVSVAVSTAAGAGGILRVGVRADGKGEPGQLIAQLPTDGTTTSTGLREATGFVPLRPGVYWFDIVFQVAAPVVRAHATSAQLAPPIDIPKPSTPDTSGTASLGVGYTCTGETGALDTTFPTAGKAVLDATSPLAWARFSVPERD